MKQFSTARRRTESAAVQQATGKDCHETKACSTPTDGTGCPSGKLTSQMSGNFFLSLLEHLATGEWDVPFYGWYVYDMALVHQSKEYLLAMCERILNWLVANGLTLHPRKMYLQYYRKGIPYIGGVVKLGRTYISNPTVGYFRDALAHYNHLAQES